MRYYSVDLKNIYTRDSLHTALKESLGLPDYYGRNLDALSDCLTDIRTDSEMEFIGLSDLMQNLMEYGERFLITLHKAAFANPHLILVFRENEEEAPNPEQNG